MLSYADLGKLHCPADAAGPNETYELVKRRIALQRDGAFLRELYAETGDGSLTQVVPSVASGKALKRLLEDQKTLQVPLQTYVDGLRTGGSAVTGAQASNEDEEPVFALGETILGKYRVEENCGNATFSSCYRVRELATGRELCLKVVKGEKDFVDQALDEARLLRYAAAMGGAESHVVTLIDAFYYREHFMLLFPLLGEDLYVHASTRERAGEQPDYSVGVIAAVARQQLEALNFLHAIGIIHLDVKPENVLLQRGFGPGDVPDSTLADLGSASFIFDKTHQYI